MDVRTLCLAALSRGDATGYEIKKMYESGPLAHFQGASFGSIYPALSRLLDDGLVQAEAREQDGRPDKKVYRLTERGREAFRGALTGPPPEPETIKSDLLFMLMFATEMTPTHVTDLIKARVTELRSLADRIEAKASDCGVGDDCGETASAGFLREPGPKFVAGYGVTIYRAAADYMERHQTDLVREIETARAALPNMAAE